MAKANAINVNLFGWTGVGMFVGDTSPLLTNPNISGEIKDFNGLSILGIQGTASAVNYVSVNNAATGNSPLIEGIGSNANVTLNIRGKGTGGVSIKGISTNTSAAAGYVGEVISSSVDSSSVSMSNGTAKTLTSISLTAGDWNVWGAVQSAPAAGTTTSSFIGAISLTNNTLPGVTTLDVTQMLVFTQLAFASGLGACISVPPSIITISSTTTVYLVASFNFAASTMNAGGAIIARRIR